MTAGGPTGSSPATVGLVRGADARPLVQGPLGALLLAGSGQTGGVLSFVVHDLAPRALGSPVHTHAHEDEWSYVLDGTLGVELDGRDVTAGPGDLVLKPRGVPHAFWNAGDTPARLLEVITPGGFEGYFEEIAALLAPSPPDLAALGALAARYGLTMDPASVPRLVAEHGLRTA